MNFPHLTDFQIVIAAIYLFFIFTYLFFYNYKTENNLDKKIWNKIFLVFFMVNVFFLLFLDPMECETYYKQNSCYERRYSHFYLFFRWCMLTLIFTRVFTYLKNIFLKIILGILIYLGSSAMIAYICFPIGFMIGLPIFYLIVSLSRMTY